MDKHTMTPSGRALLATLLALITSSTGCSRQPQPHTDQASTSSEVMLDCMIADEMRTREIWRIRADAVDSFSAAANPHGRAEITEKEYILHFAMSGDGGTWELRYRINRFTGEGAQSLLNPSGQSDPTMLKRVTCRPYSGRPL